MKLYQSKYRIETARLARFDYSAPGEYFVTVCTKDRAWWLGTIEAGTVQLSPMGVIVEEEWRKTEHVRANVELDAFVVMPNHIHGIIVIKNSVGSAADKKYFVVMTGSVISHALETTHRVVSTRNKTKTLKANSLGSIVGQFKSVSTKRIWKAGFKGFEWQCGYYDHVVRDEHDLARIREYIRLNPERWDVNDEFAVNVKMDPLHAH